MRIQIHTSSVSLRCKIYFYGKLVHKEISLFNNKGSNRQSVQQAGILIYTDYKLVIQGRIEKGRPKLYLRAPGHDGASELGYYVIKYFDCDRVLIILLINFAFYK